MSNEVKTKNKDKENTQLILLAIVTIVLSVIAVFVYIERNRPEKDIDSDNENTEIVEEVKPEFINEVCDDNLTIDRAYAKYAKYILWSAVDKDGCALTTTSYNTEYIYKMRLKSYNSAIEHSKSFSLENMSKGASIKPDSIAVLNKDGNIIGWSEILFYSEGIVASKWVFTGEEWIEIN